MESHDKDSLSLQHSQLCMWCVAIHNTLNGDKESFTYVTTESQYKSLHQEKEWGNTECCHDEVDRPRPQIVAEYDREDVGIECSGCSCCKELG